MGIKDFKTYLPFGISLLLFIVLTFYSVFIYLGWDDEPQIDDKSIEVTLPIINWSKYTNLSKQPYIDKIIKEQTQ